MRKKMEKGVKMARNGVVWYVCGYVFRWKKSIQEVRCEKK